MPESCEHGRSVARLDIGDVSLAALTETRVTLVDALGRTVRLLAHGIHQSGDNRAEVDVTELAAGVYRVVIEVDGEQSSVPLTVTR